MTFCFVAQMTIHFLKVSFISKYLQMKISNLQSLNDICQQNVKNYPANRLSMKNSTLGEQN